MQRFKVSPYAVHNPGFDLEYPTVFEVEQAMEAFKSGVMKYQQDITQEVTLTCALAHVMKYPQGIIQEATLACALADVWCAGKRYEREKHLTV